VAPAKRLRVITLPAALLLLRGWALLLLLLRLLALPTL
jgi:hypothetical protein